MNQWLIFQLLIRMNKGNSGTYEAPKVEIIEVSVEQGFAVSSVDVDPWGNGGHLGDYDVE